MRNVIIRSLVIPAVFIIAFFTLTCAAWATAQYTVTDLGTTFGERISYARAINDSGQVVGGCGDGFNYSHAFLYDHGTMTGLGGLGGWSVGESHDINNNGQVVGWSHHAFLYSNGMMSDLGTLGFYWDSSDATSINDIGQVVGAYQTTCEQYSHAFLYHDDKMSDLGTLGGGSSVATSINNSGEIVGYSDMADGHLHGFLYTNGVMADLTLLGNFCNYDNIAYAINNCGQIAGVFGYRAFFYSNGIVTNLGTVGNDNYSCALGMNDRGQVVGVSATPGTYNYHDYHAFLYSDGHLIDLNSMIDPSSGWTLCEARDINNHGQIVGYGYNSQGQQRAFLLTPKSLADKAAELAKQVVGGVYQSGAKGYDFTNHVFVSPEEILTTGYTYWDEGINGFAHGVGLDCSGLIMWAYDRAYYGERTAYPADWSLSAPVSMEGARGQYLYNSYKILPSELRPGDVLYIDSPVPDDDHMIMFVGDGMVVDARGPTNGGVIMLESLEEAETLYSGMAIYPRRIGKPELVLVAHSPVDLIITDPQGRIVSRDTCDMPYADYFEFDMDGDGELEDMISIGLGRIGNYTVQVVPEAGASPDESYSLWLANGNEVTWLAQDVAISDIPSGGYVFYCTVPEAGTVAMIVPAVLGFAGIAVRRTRRK